MNKTTWNRCRSKILTGDCIQSMKTLETGSVHCCVTSPPYYGLRDYGHDGQIGLEETPDAYVKKMVEVFSEVKRVLRDDGTLWLNLGDSYWGGKGENGSSKARATAEDRGYIQSGGTVQMAKRPQDGKHETIKPKDLIGIPWRVAFALQSDGWYLRQDIIWHKPNPMPESVRDRCTKAHEYIFLLSKSQKYYFDSEAMKEPLSTKAHAPGNRKLDASRNDHNQMQKIWGANGTRNRRSVWTVTTKPYRGAHFATFPPDLIRPCILAGCPKDGIVLDPFGGSGTTGAVAKQEGRNFILCELNPEYIRLAEKRIDEVHPRLI